MLLRRFEYKIPPSNKFWSIGLSLDVNGVYNVLRRWGRIGANGTDKYELFSDSERAQRWMDDQIRQKVRDGYREVFSSVLLDTKRTPAVYDNTIDSRERQNESPNNNETPDNRDTLVINPRVIEL